MGLLDGLIGQLVQQAAEKMLNPQAPLGQAPQWPNANPAGQSGAPGLFPQGNGSAGAVLGRILPQIFGTGPSSPTVTRQGGNSGLLLMLLPFVLAWIQRQGGLSAVLGRLGRSGLQSQANSWVNLGPNLPLTGQEVQQVFGADELHQIASQYGLGTHEVAQGIATLLPQLVDHLTPAGNLQQADTADQDIQGLLQSVQQWTRG